MSHIHFDLKAAEKALRDGIRSTIAEGMRLAPSDADRELVRLQGDLEDFTVAFALWDMRRLNDGGQRADQAAADALGYSIGNLIASFVENSGGGDATLDLVMQSLWRACTVRLSGSDDSDAILSSTSIQAMQSGSA